MINFNYNTNLYPYFSNYFGLKIYFLIPKCYFQSLIWNGTRQVGLGVGSWPSNRATKVSNPKGTRLYFVILLKNVDKNL